MAKILLSYDISDKQTAVKAELLSISGYAEKWIDSNNVWHNLPDTTLLFTGNKTTQNVYDDLQNACRKHSVTCYRCIAAELTGNWTGK